MTGQAILVEELPELFFRIEAGVRDQFGNCGKGRGEVQFGGQVRGWVERLAEGNGPFGQVGGGVAEAGQVEGDGVEIAGELQRIELERRDLVGLELRGGGIERELEGFEKGNIGMGVLGTQNGREGSGLETAPEGEAGKPRAEGFGE